MAGQLAEEGCRLKSSAMRTCVLALLATFAIAGIAGAHQLKISRAANANRSFTHLLCSATNEDPESTCLASKPGGCKRISEHRVRCALFITLEAADESRARCLALTEWTIRNRSNALRPHFLGVKSCTELRGPDPALAPEPTG